MDSSPKLDAVLNGATGRSAIAHLNHFSFDM